VTDRPAPVFASPADLPAPAGYSHVVAIPSGRLVWTSGQVAIAADGSVPPGREAQTRLVFENVGRALAAAGAGWRDVVKLTFFDVAVEELPTVRSVRDEFVDASAPSRRSPDGVGGPRHPANLACGRARVQDDGAAAGVPPTSLPPKERV
jgi:enamine deaminase RidA (YjgF/YER057c/UK114 family)